MKKIFFVGIFFFIIFQLYGQGIRPKQLEYAPGSGYVLISKDTTALYGRTGKYDHFNLENYINDSLNIEAGVDSIYLVQDSILTWTKDGNTYSDTIRVESSDDQTLSIDSTNISIGKLFSLGIEDGNEVKFRDIYYVDTVFVQATAPVSYKQGDIWVDSDDNKTYMQDGTGPAGWELIAIWDEEDPIYATDSSNIVWFQDTLTTIATKTDISGITGDNIYNSDGTLTGNREVDLNSNDLGFTDGDVGIGTTSPSEALDVVGKISLNDGGNSVFVGEGAGENDDGTDNRNVGVGYQSFYSNNTGSYNTANGYRSLYSNTTGNNNTANGYQTLYANTGDSNTANGYRSLYSNTTGSDNTANGMYSLRYNTTGSSNTSLGYYAGYNSTGSTNLFLGYQSGDNLTSGDNNIAIGSVDFASATGSNQLNIGDLITGDMSGGTVTFNSAYTFPSSDGTADQVLTTNGSGTLSWGDAATGDTTYFSKNTGIIYPKYSTDKILVGSTNYAAYGNTALNVVGNASFYGESIYKIGSSTWGLPSPNDLHSSDGTNDWWYAPDLDLSGNTLKFSLEGTGVNTGVDLSGYLDNTDDQTLQEVTNQGATTTNDIETGDITINANDGKLTFNSDNTLDYKIELDQTNATLDFLNPNTVGYMSVDFNDYTGKTGVRIQPDTEALLIMDGASTTPDTSLIFSSASGSYGEIGVDSVGTVDYGEAGEVLRKDGNNNLSWGSANSWARVYMDEAAGYIDISTSEDIIAYSYITAQSDNNYSIDAFGVEVATSGYYEVSISLDTEETASTATVVDYWFEVDGALPTTTYEKFTQSYASRDYEVITLNDIIYIEANETIRVSCQKTGSASGNVRVKDFSTLTIKKL